MRGRLLFLAALSGSLLLVAHPAMAAWEGEIVRRTPTHNWSVPSSDPTGLTYIGRSGRFLISDSEIDEAAPSIRRGRNLFVAGRKGGLIASRRLLKATREPEAIVWYGRTKSLFVADDDRDAVYRFKPGRDGIIGTPDDPVKKLLNTRRYGSGDPEGLAWNPRARMFIFVDATDRIVYKVRRGPDLRWNTADDQVRRFGTFRYGFTDPEGVTWDPVTGHLFIVSSRQNFVLHTTLKGKVVRKIVLPWCAAACNLSDLVFAPGTDGSRRRLYLTDRGKDNDAFPNPADYNDGELFQVRLVRT